MEEVREEAAHFSRSGTTDAIEGELRAREVGDELAELAGADVVVADDNVATIGLHALDELIVV